LLLQKPNEASSTVLSVYTGSCLGDSHDEILSPGQHSHAPTGHTLHHKDDHLQRNDEGGVESAARPVLGNTEELGNMIPSTVNLESPGSEHDLELCHVLPALSESLPLTEAPRTASVTPHLCIFSETGGSSSNRSGVSINEIVLNSVSPAPTEPSTEQLSPGPAKTVQNRRTVGGSRSPVRSQHLVEELADEEDESFPSSLVASDRNPPPSLTNSRGKDHEKKK
jgi:hypothetical protein